MLLIDRYIVGRFLLNFAILFLLLFVFAVSIDLILNLDRFVERARAGSGDAGLLSVGVEFVRLVFNFEGPRLFQFYAYLHGLVAVGAMGFTLADMHRHKELVAVLASGVSMYRIAVPFLAAVLGFSFLQLFNQEVILPRIAPLLLRTHGHIGLEGVRGFNVPLTVDGNGNLLQSPSFDPQTETLLKPTMLKRDEHGRTTQRITADSARWDAVSKQGWRLDNGRVISLPSTDPAAAPSLVLAQPIELFATDLTPEALTIRRHGQYGTMLSLSQIATMLEAPGGVDADALVRYRAGRFATVLLNLLVMLITLPFFLLREPANLMLQSVWCAATTVPAMLGALVGMAVELPGIAPTLGAFLPVIILLPISLARVTYVKT